METKYKTLDDVRNFLNGIPFINSGGCGISALAMYRWLEKNYPKHAKKTVFYFFHRDKDDYRNNKSLIKNNSYDNTNISIPSHIGIQIKNVTDVIDCYREVFIRQYEYVVKTTSEDVLINAINNVCGWNWFFNRKQSVHVIAKELDIDLSDVFVSVKVKELDIDLSDVFVC
jgi:hypothetical protein